MTVGMWWIAIGLLLGYWAVVMVEAVWSAWRDMDDDPQHLDDDEEIAA